jgi:hypothetical protein
MSDVLGEYRAISLFAVCLIIATVASARKSKQEEIKFPSDDDVKLVLTQAHRTTEQYAAAVQLADKLLGQTGKEGVEKDRQVLEGLNVLLSGLDKHPDKSNGILGFELITSLDDASRDAHICAGSAVTFGSKAGMEGKTTSATALFGLAQSCQNSGVLLYTVSESASSDVRKYLKNIERLAEQATEVRSESGGGE